MFHPFGHNHHSFLDWRAASGAGYAGIANNQAYAVHFGHLSTNLLYFVCELEYGHLPAHEQAVSENGRLNGYEMTASQFHHTLVLYLAGVINMYC